jgi:hypothetical protein
LYIGPGNALATTGASWRWCRSAALSLGVRLVGHGRKQFIPAAEFQRALASGIAKPEEEAPAVATADELRSALGLRLVRGSP